MKSLADFKREAVPGSVWRCTNAKHPNVSGTRTILGGKTVLSYSYERADGQSGTNGRLEFPKRDEARFDGDTVEFLEAGEVIFAWTKVA